MRSVTTGRCARPGSEARAPGGGIRRDGRHTDPGRDASRVRRRPGLSEADLAADWLAQFAAGSPRRSPPGWSSRTRWCVGDRRRRRRPSGRTVLLKGYDPRGFVFFTNYGSRKGARLAANPYATLVFPWVPMQRQVIVAGRSSRWTGPSRRRTSPAGRAARSSAPGPARSRRWCRTGPRWTTRYRAAAERSPTRSRCRRRRTGAGCGCAGVGGVLAGPGQPAARPAAVPADGGGAWIVERLAP